jgi:hypothetical protein
LPFETGSSWELAGKAPACTAQLPAWHDELVRDKKADVNYLTASLEAFQVYCRFSPQADLIALERLLSKRETNELRLEVISGFCSAAGDMLLRTTANQPEFLHAVLIQGTRTAGWSLVHGRTAVFR